MVTVKDRNYHHNDLPAALLEAVDGLVRERGAGAVSLREAARRAGVSHAAPAHHFGDKAGLLTAYATQGFAALANRLSAAGAEAKAAARSQLVAIGSAYVRFAVEEPGRFKVMFRPDALHDEEPRFQEACEAAYSVLRDAVCELRPDLEPADPELLHAGAGAWSIVHGFATLWLDGNFADEIRSEPPAEATAAILEAFGTTLHRALSVEPRLR